MSNENVKMGKVDVLAIAVHPDDAELGCSGTLLKAVAAGKRVAVCDMTAGELGTRGSAELRLKESLKSNEILGSTFRINLGMADGFFEVTAENKMKLIQVIRACRPDVVLCNAISDRHPDHGRASELQKVACFLSGLQKIESELNGKAQESWRPRLVLHYIQDHFIAPNIIVDITEYWERKMESIMAFSSQFYDPNSQEPESAISSKEFIEFQEGRALQMGRFIGVRYGEGFTSDRPLGIDQLSDLI